MTSLDAKLFAWYRLQTQYEAGRERLKVAMGNGVDDAAVQVLHADLERLRDRMDAALREIDQLRQQRAQPGTPDR